MKASGRLLSRRGFLATSLLGGMIAPLLKPEKVVSAAPFYDTWGAIRTTFLPIPSISIAQPVSQLAKIGDIGKFTTVDPNSLVEIIYEGHVKATGGGRTIFTLVVETTNAGIFEVLTKQLDKSVYAHFTGIARWLPVGIHTLSVWGLTSTQPGGATFINPDVGNFEMVSIKEYLPLNTTYLPMIQK